MISESTMLSHPRSSLQERHRQHRRQISTPTTLEPGKVPSLSAPVLQRYQAHRRGQSLDQRSLQVRRQQPVQDGSGGTLPITTNGTVYQPPQHMMMREAQPQQLTQDGLLSIHQHSTPTSVMVEPQALTQEDLRALTRRTDSENSPSMSCMGPNTVRVGSTASEIQPLKLALSRIQQQQLRESTLAYGNVVDHRLLDNGTWGLYQQDGVAALQQQANGIPNEMRRSSIQSDASPQTQRPCTSLIQTNGHYRPITPATTPFRMSVDLSSCTEDIQTSPAKNQYLSVPSTTEPLYMQRARSLEGVAGTTFTTQKIEMPSPPNTASFDIDHFDVFDYQQASSAEDSESHHLSQSHHSASSSSVASSFYSPSERSDIPSPEDSKPKAQKIPILPITSRRGSPQKSPNTTPSLSPTKPKLSPRVASIGHLNLDSRVQASIKETGITIDEIASFIHGPDPEDGKWVCLHPGCGRRFGRKENIKSHVQTHLGDRQYKCDHCNKCFVRGHDLKRHAKIHTGDKPYECLCGNVFARHDALTRHRQRGMCIGAYKGIVRKTTKRGRPRKQRPEMGERQEKAAKSRKKDAEKSASLSGSDTSRNSPPSEVLKNMHIGGSSPTSTVLVFHKPDYSLPPAAFSFTPPASPGYNTASQTSDRSYRSLTPSTEDEMMSKRSLEKVVQESGLPTLDKRLCPTADIANSNALPSPRNAPTLTDSSTVSDLDIFISQGPTSFTKDGVQYFDDPDMAEFPGYSAAASTFGESMDLFSAKSFSTGAGLGDDDFFSFQFNEDEQPSDVLTGDFYMD